MIQKMQVERDVDSGHFPSIVELFGGGNVNRKGEIDGEKGEVGQNGKLGREKVVGKGGGMSVRRVGGILGNVCENGEREEWRRGSIIGGSGDRGDYLGKMGGREGEIYVRGRKDGKGG